MARVTKIISSDANNEGRVMCITSADTNVALMAILFQKHLKSVTGRLLEDMALFSQCLDGEGSIMQNQLVITAAM